MKPRHRSQRYFRLHSLAPVVLGMLVGSACAQPQPSAREEAGVQRAQPQPRPRPDMYRGSKIIGSQVRDLDGRRIGEIHELVLGSRRGEVAYAVVSFGGVLGVGKSFHAVPWISLQPRAGGRYYVLNADRATLRNAPSLDLARWPDLDDQAWREEVDSYWARAVGQAVDAANDPLSAPLGAGASGGGAPAEAH